MVCALTKFVPGSVPDGVDPSAIRAKLGAAWQQGSVSSEAGRRSPCPPVWDSACPEYQPGPKARPSLMALAMP